MFIGIVLIITVASIAVLAMVNNYYLAFSNNYWDINEYYSSKYATISAIERSLNTRKSDGSLMTGKIVTWYSYPNIELDWDYNYKRIWTGELVIWEDGSLYISGYMWDYYDNVIFSVSGENLSITGN